MGNVYFKEPVMSYEGAVRKFYAKVTTSTGGAIASQVAKGLSVAKTGSEVGRYTVTMSDSYTSLLGVSAVVEGAADAAYVGGCIPLLRNVAVSSDPATFDLQFLDAASADAEVADGAVIYLEVTVKNTSAF